MKITMYPSDVIFPKCIVLVGGSGDTPKGFTALVNKINGKYPDNTICTFGFSTSSESESLLDVQARELNDVFEQLKRHHNFKQIDIFATSMGAYAAIKLLSTNKYQGLIKKVIFYDPADYYLSAKFEGSNDVTWSGSQQYLPNGTVISDELAKLKGDYKINIVHLTLRNYSPKGYIDSDYLDRGRDHQNGCPRLSTDMIKAMFSKIPAKNRGKYIEESNVPHGFLRDGNIQANIEKVSTTIVDIITK